MSEVDRERLRWMFTQDAELYDRCRPGYPPRLFDDLALHTGLGLGSRVLEIGCGTGQATVPMARLGCRIVAVELGADLAAVAQHNLAGFPGTEIVVAAFEDWQLPAAKFEVVLAATAFHWIDPAVRMVKAADALRPGGVLAVISTHHVAGGSDTFFVAGQECYRRSGGTTPLRSTLPAAADVPRDSTEFDQSGRFGPVQFHRYEWERTYTTGEYLNLLSTYSTHRILGRGTRQGLFTCLANLIDDEHGGTISKRYLTQMALASRTH